MEREYLAEELPPSSSRLRLIIFFYENAASTSSLNRKELYETLVEENITFTCERVQAPLTVELGTFSAYDRFVAVLPI